MITDKPRTDHYRHELKRHTAHDRAIYKTYDEKRLEELRKAAGQTKEKGA